MTSMSRTTTLKQPDAKGQDNPPVTRLLVLHGEIEGDPEYGYPPAIRKVQREIASGLRPASGRLRPAGGLDED